MMSEDVLAHYWITARAEIESKPRGKREQQPKVAAKQPALRNEPTPAARLDA